MKRRGSKKQVRRVYRPRIVRITDTEGEEMIFEVHPGRTMAGARVYQRQAMKGSPLLRVRNPQAKALVLGELEDQTAAKKMQHPDLLTMPEPATLTWWQRVRAWTRAHWPPGPFPNRRTP